MPNLEDLAMVRRQLYAIVVGLLVLSVGVMNADAGKGSGGGGKKPPPSPSYLNSPPCVMSDFSRIPGAAIYDPVTGEVVPAGGSVWVQYGANSGIWLGDPTFGPLLGVQLYVDDKV